MVKSETVRRSKLLRLVSEAVVIFAGVGLALLADDWRETRGDRDEAMRSLELIERDLERDSAQIAEGIAEMSSDAEASRWLLAHWEGVDPDSSSLFGQLVALRASARPAFSRAGFEGLRASNGIRLLRNDALRDSLLYYYEVTQPQFTEYYFEVVWPRRGLVNEALAPHLRTFRLADGGGLTLRTSWSEITADPAVEHHLASYHGAIAYSATALRELQSKVAWLLRRTREGRGLPGG
jgi:hypothetical protein